MRRRIQQLVFSIRRTLVVVASLSVIATGLAVIDQSLPSPAADGPQTGGWGGESLAGESTHTGTFSLIGVANACGLGASSCFKCHNGQRADEPDMDQATAPWHVQHQKVNHSCAGCHDGNPRIIRKQMAHRDLIANPNETPDRSCAGCHENDADEYLQRYLAAASGEK